MDFRLCHLSLVWSTMMWTILTFRSCHPRRLSPPPPLLWAPTSHCSTHSRRMNGFWCVFGNCWQCSRHWSKNRQTSRWHCRLNLSLAQRWDSWRASSHSEAAEWSSVRHRRCFHCCFFVSAVVCLKLRASEFVLRAAWAGQCHRSHRCRPDSLRRSSLRELHESQLDWNQTLNSRSSRVLMKAYWRDFLRRKQRSLSSSHPRRRRWMRRNSILSTRVWIIHWWMDSLMGLRAELMFEDGSEKVARGFVESCSWHDQALTFVFLAQVVALIWVERSWHWLRMNHLTRMSCDVPVLSWKASERVEEAAVECQSLRSTSSRAERKLSVRTLSFHSQHIRHLTSDQPTRIA